MKTKSPDHSGVNRRSEDRDETRVAERSQNIQIWNVGRKSVRPQVRSESLLRRDLATKRMDHLQTMWEQSRA